MEGDFEEDSHQRLTVVIRILSSKKKSSFRTARVKGFPVAERREEFQNKVKKILPGEKFTKNFSFRFRSFPIVTCLMCMPSPSMVKLFG